MNTEQEIRLIQIENRVACAYKLLEAAMEFSWARNVMTAQRELQHAIRDVHQLRHELVDRPVGSDIRSVLVQQVVEQREYMRTQGENMDGYAAASGGDKGVGLLNFNTDWAELARRRAKLAEFDIRGGRRAVENAGARTETK